MRNVFTWVVILVCLSSLLFGTGPFQVEKNVPGFSKTSLSSQDAIETAPSGLSRSEQLPRPPASRIELPIIAFGLPASLRFHRQLRPFMRTVLAGSSTSRRW